MLTLSLFILSLYQPSLSSSSLMELVICFDALINNSFVKYIIFRFIIYFNLYLSTLSPLLPSQGVCYMYVMSLSITTSQNKRYLSLLSTLNVKVPWKPRTNKTKLFIVVSNNLKII